MSTETTHSSEGEGLGFGSEVGGGLLNTSLTSPHWRRRKGRAGEGGRLEFKHVSTSLHGILESTRYAGEYTVCWRVHGMLESTRYAGEYTVCWRVHGILESTRYAGEYTVCWRVHGMLESTRYAGEYTVCWRVHGMLLSYYILHAETIKCYPVSLTCGMRGLIELLAQYL